MARERAKKFDAKKLDKLDKVEIDVIVEKGLRNGKTDPAALIKQCDEGIQAIRRTKGYSEKDIEKLIWSWERVKECLQAIQQGKPLPKIEIVCKAERNGAMCSGGVKVFKGSAKRAVEIMREIGLKDTANGKSWSKLWGHMDRTVTPLGKMKNGDPVVAVTVVLAVNKMGFIYEQVLNVRTIEHYSEYDLGNGCYVIFQNMICDDSAGQRPRGYKNKKKKPYYPVVEQISMTVIQDNKDGTFALGNFMSTKAQPLKVIKGFWAKLFGGLVDLKKTTEKDTVKNREKWNELFQKAVLEPKKK
ncbi:MAG: hypothetical protein GXP25_08555 [Planctomycetes bacterium]|nr:hypothetical protein [Planctomycetota bacterium]